MICLASRVKNPAAGNVQEAAYLALQGRDLVRRAGAIRQVAALAMQGIIDLRRRHPLRLDLQAASQRNKRQNGPDTVGFHDSATASPSTTAVEQL